MAAATTLYRFSIELSHVDRGVYQTLELRLAQHPSEPIERVVARALAYALLYEEGLELGKGLDDADEPALWTRDLTGRLLHWIDLGHPSAERLHLASKKAERVSIFCHKDLEVLRRELEKRKIHRAEQIAIWGIAPSFVAELGSLVERNTQLSVLVNDGELSVTIQDRTCSTQLERPAWLGN